MPDKRDVDHGIDTIDCPDCEYVASARSIDAAAESLKQHSRYTGHRLASVHYCGRK